jgi:hypothetical protein
MNCIRTSPSLIRNSLPTAIYGEACAVAVTVTVTKSTFVPVLVVGTVAVVVVTAVAVAGIVTVAVAEGDLIRQLQAELMRVAGTVARMVERFTGVVASRASTLRLTDGAVSQAA